MGSAPSAPTLQNPNQTAANQWNYNLQAGELSQAGSMVNQTNPYESLTYSQTGTGPNGVPIYSASVNLSPAQQQMLDALNQGKTAAANQSTSLLNNANYGSQNPSDVIGNMTSGTTQQMLNQETSYLQPFFTQDTNNLDAQLRNQGFSPGTPAYDNAMNNLRQSQGQTVTGFLAQAEPQAYSQALTNYTLPASLAAALGTYGTPTTPNFQTTPTANYQPPNYTGAVANYNQAEIQNYQNQLNQYGNEMSGIFGIPTAILGGWASSPSGGSALSGLFGAL